MSASTLTSEYVTDTMALVLRVERRRMGANAASVFDAVETGAAVIYVPAMVLAEILYLAEKRRISASLSTVADYMRKYPACKEYSMTFSVVESAGQITDIPELHDRLIAATARFLELELITNDPVIATSQFVRTRW